MKRTVVTSALPYINGVKHLGNLIGSMLPADIYVRFLRQRGEDVIYICGTDEHGSPAEIAAAEKGLPVDEYCERMYNEQKRIYDAFELSFDYFGRSSSPENHDVSQELFKGLYDNGLVKEGNVTQIYDTDDARFLPDRFVEGTCPHCGYEWARGDQCENCTRLLDATDLLNPRSAVSGSTALERRESPHLFLRLTLLEDRLSEWLRGKEGYWPPGTLSIARKWLNEGLKDRSITRDLKWGIPVPLSGFENKVFYVWYDAPNGYIAMTRAWAKERGEPDAWKTYWHDPDTRLVQFMAKDNVPFHAIIWPAILMGADQGYTIVDFIKGFEWLNFEGGKFSTSGQRGIFTDLAIELFPADYWRLYLTSIAPEKADSDFTLQGFQTTVGNLADELGNFVHRALTFLNRYFDGRPAPENVRPNDELWNRIGRGIGEAEEHLSGMSFGAYVRSLRSLWAEGNRYFTEQEPWATRKTAPDEAQNALFNAACLARSFAIVSSPLIPNASDRIFRLLGLEGSPASISWEEARNPSPFSSGHEIRSEIEPLFRKIEDDRIQELGQRVGVDFDPKR